jgi:DNA-binding NarL/FixJ family response regulator
MEDLGRAVFVIDDDEGERQLVLGLLERAGYTTMGFETGEDALVFGAKHPPGVVILDIKLPGISGYEVCRQLKETFGTSLPVLFVSGVRVEPFDRAAGLLVGADDYIVKPFEPDELLARVRKHQAPRARTAEPSPSAEALTPRELEVLRLLADGLAQAEIAERLVISAKTVSTHIQHVLEKLGVHSRAQAVAAAHRLGLNGPADA